MTPLGTPSAPNLPVDTVVGTLNGTPWPWIYVWSNTFFETGPNPEQTPIKRYLYQRAAVSSDHQFFGSFTSGPYVAEIRHRKSSR